MIGVIKGTMRQKKEVNGLPLPIASYKANMKAPIRSLKIAITATQSGSGTPAPDNIRPFIGVSECNVVRCGANVLDLTRIVDNEYYSLNNDGSLKILQNDGRAWASFEPQFFLKKGDYVLLRSNPLGYCALRTSLDNYVSTFVSTINNTSKTFTLSDDAFIKIKIGVGLNSADYPFNSFDGINYPANDTDYHAYTGNTYTIQLGDTYYGGSLDVTTGELTVNWGSEDLGNLNYQYNANTNIFTSTNMTNFREPTSTGQRRTGFLCDIYPPSSTVTINANMDDKSMLRLSGQINIRDTSYTSAESFKSAMSGHQLIYSLATPITVQLTPTQIEQLLANNVFADTGDVEELEYTDRQVYYGK